MDIQQKEIFKFVFQELLWCLDEEKDIYTQDIRSELSDELIEELINDVNQEFNINIQYTAQINEMDIFQFCEYIYKNLNNK